MHQLKIMLDTNILISLIIFGGQVQNVFVELINMRHRMFVSTYIDHEFRDKDLLELKEKLLVKIMSVNDIKNYLGIIK